MPDRPPRAFIDTNIWISAFINPGGPPARVVEALEEGRFIPIISTALVEEIQDALNRPRIRRRRRFTDEQVARVLHTLEERAIRVVPSGTLRLCRDPDDDIMLESAVLGRANVVVSRDDDIKRDLELIDQLRRRGIEVLSVAQFLDLLGDRAAP